MWLLWILAAPLVINTGSGLQIDYFHCLAECMCSLVALRDRLMAANIHPVVLDYCSRSRCLARLVVVDLADHLSSWDRMVGRCLVRHLDNHYRCHCHFRFHFRCHSHFHSHFRSVLHLDNLHHYHFHHLRLEQLAIVEYVLPANKEKNNISKQWA